MLTFRAATATTTPSPTMQPHCAPISFITSTSSFPTLLLATVGYRLVSVGLQDFVASRTLALLKQQIQPKQPLRDWLDDHELALAPTTVLFVPPLVATVAADVVSTLLLYPLEIELVKMHIATVPELPSVGTVLALYTATPVWNVLCEAMLRSLLVYSTATMLQNTSTALAKLCPV